MSKSNQPVLTAPVGVAFTIKMETDKAVIVENLSIAGQPYISSTNLPKMYVANMVTKDDTTTAQVESWIVKQRFDELYSPNAQVNAQALLEQKYPKAEVQALPWD